MKPPIAGTKTRYVTACTLALLALHGCASLDSTIDSRGELRGSSGSSQPPDTRTYSRPLIPEDLTVASRPRARAAPSSGLTFQLVTLVDVNDIDSRNGSEPSIAVNPENPNVIAVHGGFGDWGAGGHNCASLYVSTDGGATWNRRASIDPPTNVDVCNPNTQSCGPNDATFAYGANSELTGSFLGEGDLFTGATSNPSTTASFRWHTISTGVVEPAEAIRGFPNNCSGTGTTPFVQAQPTEQIATHGNDQPWVVVHSHLPDPIILERRRDGVGPFPFPMQNDVYVAYSDFSGTGCNAVPVRVAVSASLADPPDFVIDRQVGSGGSRCAVNPGHRLAVAPTTKFTDGTTGSGFVYSVHQRCNDCSATPPLIDIVLNRTTDRGATWSVNGNSGGIVVATVPSQQPNPKFGTVNALKGGIDHVTADPSTGDVYVVYGVFDPAVGHNRLQVVRLFYVKCSEFFSCNALVADAPVFVDDGQSPAALPAIAVAQNGTVGVLYDTFEGMISGLPVFTVHLSLAAGRRHDLAFETQSLLAFLSPAPDNGDGSQRVLGDFQQMVAVGNRFYGAFTGTGAWFGRTTISNDPIVFIADVAGAAPIAATKWPASEGPMQRR